jgi:HK97 family phage portal protein
MNALEKQTLNIKRFGTPSPNVFDRLKAAFGNNLLFSGRTNYDWTAIYHYSKASKEALVHKGYATNVTVYAAITTISRVAAQAPWGIFTVKNAGAYQRLKSLQSQPYSKEQQQAIAVIKEQALEPYEGHYLNDKFRNPNEQQSGAEYMENLLGYKLLTGDSYEWANMTSAKRVAEFWILPSQKVEIMTGEYGSFPMREKGYKVLIGSKSISYEAEEVCHSRYWSPFYSGDGDNLYGFSPLDAAWLSNLQDNNAREAAVELLKNRGKRGVFMWQNPNITDQEVMVAESDRFKEKWRQSDKEYKDSVPSMFGTGEFIEMGLGAKDLAILEICKMNKDDICNAYGISSILLNNMESTNVDNYKTARKELITRCVLPLLGTIRDARNRKLAGDWNPKNEKIVCDFDQTIFTELYEDVWEMADKMKTVGVYTDNEIRVQTNFEKLTNKLHDEVWKKTNDVPVSLVSENTLSNTGSNGAGK